MDETFINLLLLNLHRIFNSFQFHVELFDFVEDAVVLGISLEKCGLLLQFSDLLLLLSIIFVLLPVEVLLKKYYFGESSQLHLQIRNFRSQFVKGLVSPVVLVLLRLGIWLMSHIRLRNIALCVLVWRVVVWVAIVVYSVRHRIMINLMSIRLRPRIEVYLAVLKLFL